MSIDWEKPDAQLMREFTDRMQQLYNMAEGLRDCAGGKDKDIFNQTRGALYELQYKAKEQASRWERGERA